MMKYLSITIFSALLILSSCVREEMPDGCETDAKLITFSPAVEASVQTKSTESWPSESWKLTDEAGEFAIPLTYYSAVNTSDCFSKSGTEGDAEIETKGVKINDISEISSFFVCAYDENSDRFIPSSGDGNYFEEVTNKNGTWSADGEFEWTNNAYRTFYAYANKRDGDGIECYSQSYEGLEFTYTVPESASSQTDFLLGYYTGTPDECEEDSGTLCKVPMSFTHAMASVRFMLSPSLKIVDRHKITEIKISGVYKRGTVKIEPEGIITWSDCSIGDDFSVSESEPVYVSDSDSDYSIGESFFLIPQSEGKVTITVTIKNTANDEESRKVTATLKPEWQAGHSYVYIFGEGFMPEICDDTSIKNVGNEAGYFRVAVIAYVVDGSGVVVGPSTVSPAINTADGGWTSDGNGFYYYDSKVERGQSTPVIVTNKGAIKESDANAKLKILVQASKDPFNN